MARRKSNVTYERCSRCASVMKCYNEGKRLSDLFVCKEFKEKKK